MFMHVDGMISCIGANWFMHEGSALFGFRNLRIYFPGTPSEVQEARLWQD